MSMKAAVVALALAAALAGCGDTQAPAPTTAPSAPAMTAHTPKPT